MTVLKAKVMGECVVHARKNSAPLSANSWNVMEVGKLRVLFAQKQLLHTSVANAKRPS